jgi:hypothetical protein
MIDSSAAPSRRLRRVRCSQPAARSGRSADSTARRICGGLRLRRRAHAGTHRLLRDKFCISALCYYLLALTHSYLLTSLHLRWRPPSNITTAFRLG